MPIKINPALLSAVGSSDNTNPGDNSNNTSGSDIPNTYNPKWPMIASAAGSLADILTTQHALGQGGIETNPFLPQNRVGNALALAGTNLATQYLIHRLAKNHPNWAKFVGYGTAADSGLSALNNMGIINYRFKHPTPTLGPSRK